MVGLGVAAVCAFTSSGDVDERASELVGCEGTLGGHAASSHVGWVVSPAAASASFSGNPQTVQATGTALGTAGTTSPGVVSAVSMPVPVRSIQVCTESGTEPRRLRVGDFPASVFQGLLYVARGLAAARTTLAWRHSRRPASGMP